MFKGKTIIITGATRGIGKAIALKLAADGANIVVAAKSTEENPKLGGTIYSAAKEIEAAGGQALPVMCDVRDEQQIYKMVENAAAQFGGVDVLINNASAISLTPTEKTEPKRYDLMQDVNVRGTFFTSQACIPWLKKSTNAHILTLSPPLNMDMKWIANHVAYTISKYGMTMVTLGIAAELKKYNIAANTLWPKTTIATAAVQNLLGGDTLINMSRTTDIVADAAYEILRLPAASATGNTYIDEEILTTSGITDFDKYSVVPGSALYPDLFL